MLLRATDQEILLSAPGFGGNVFNAINATF
jgi:hypothetical protein